MKKKNLKKEIRESLLQIRKKQPRKERIKKSLTIWRKLKTQPEFLKAETVMFYLSLPDEVDTQEMVKESIKIGKRVVVPVSKAKKRKLILSVLKNYDRELRIGTFNIPEPKKRYIRKVALDIIDLVLIPGVAFDRKCGRLGFGKGFYDYFLKSLSKNVLTVALAFDFQVLARLPLEKHDVFVDKIITERRIIKKKKVSK